MCDSDRSKTYVAPCPLHGMTHTDFQGTFYPFCNSAPCAELGHLMVRSYKRFRKNVKEALTERASVVGELLRIELPKSQNSGSGPVSPQRSAPAIISI